MLDDVIAGDGTLDSMLLDELYYEALELSNLVVEYLTKHQNESFQHLGVELMGAYTLECNRITTGIMQAMSWCLMQKGVRSGEVSQEKAAEEASRLSDENLFKVPVSSDNEKLPAEFMEYSNRARALYDRIVRLDRLLYDMEKSDKNPVQNLFNKIDEI